MNDKNATRNVINDDLDPQLEAAVWAVVQAPLPKEAIERVKSQASALGNEHQPVVRANSRVANWDHLWTKISALAACLLVAFGALTMLPSRGAFAQVIEKIRNVTTAKFTIENIGDPGFVAIARVKAPAHFRLDFQIPTKTVNITNGNVGELISYDENSDQVTVNSIPKANSNFDILQLLMKPDVNAIPSSEVNTIAGTQLYEIFSGEGRIWIDNSTKLPKRIEMTPPKGTGGTKLVYRDFEWDVPLDDSLFSMPLGRKIVRSSLLAPPLEEELIAAFSIRQAFSRDPYDASFLDRSTKPGLKLGQLAYDLSKGQVENFQLQTTKLQGSWTVIGISPTEASDPSLVQKRIDYLCMKLDQWASNISRTGGWVGTGVRPGEPKPLCWWRTGNQIRVLLGDLKIVDSEQPPTSN